MQAISLARCAEGKHTIIKKAPTERPVRACTKPISQEMILIMGKYPIILSYTENFVKIIGGILHGNSEKTAERKLSCESVR